MPSCKDNQLLGFIVKSGFRNRIVPIRHTFTDNGRPCRLCVLVNIIHDKNINGFTCQSTTDTNRLEAAPVSYNLAFIRIAQPRPGNRGHIGGIKVSFREYLVVFGGVDYPLDFTVELSCFGGIVRHNRQPFFRVIAKKKGGQTPC